MDPTGSLILRKKSGLTKKNVKVTTQDEIEPTIEFTEPYSGHPMYDAVLFPEGSPKPEDVTQALVGNCYLLSALLAFLDREDGRVFINGTMKDVGPDDKTKPASDTNPAWVVVRLYANRAYGSNPAYGGKAKYIKVKKCVQKDERGRDVFQSGPLWVHMLVAAFTHFDGAGFFQGKSSFARIEAGNSNWVFAMLTGEKGHIHEIMDFAKLEGRADITRDSTIRMDYGANLALFSNKLRDPKAAGSDEILTKVFGGNAAHQRAYVEWLQAPTRGRATAFGSRGAPLRGSLLDALMTRQQKTLRREHVEQLFRENSPNAGTTAVMSWIDANQLLPGKRFTKRYTHYDLKVLNFIRTNHGMRPVCIGTRPVLGVGDLGQAGETKVKGLASGHGYAVYGVETDDDGEHWITVRNPWGSYGRSYSNGKAIANPTDSPVSRLTLGDVMKCFKVIAVAHFKWQG